MHQNGDEKCLLETHRNCFHGNRQNATVLPYPALHSFILCVMLRNPSLCSTHQGCRSLSGPVVAFHLSQVWLSEALGKQMPVTQLGSNRRASRVVCRIWAVLVPGSHHYHESLLIPRVAVGWGRPAGSGVTRPAHPSVVGPLREGFCSRPQPSNPSPLQH